MTTTTDIAEARRAYGRAIQARDFPAILAAGETLVTLEPGNALAWFNHGYFLRAVRRFDEALAAYERAIAAGLDRPQDAHINRAAILLDQLVRPAEAEAELRAALAAAPGEVAAWLSLGQLHEDLGRAAEAAEDYRHLLAVDPGIGRAHARLARIAAAGGDHGGTIAALEAVLPRMPAGSDDRAEVAMALGQSLEASGRVDEAFARYAEANAIGEALAPDLARYDPAAVERLVDALIALPVPLPAADGAPPFAPVFLVGVLRSGSTLAERVLARHPRVTAGGELGTIPGLVEAMPDYPASLARQGADDFARMRDIYAAEVASRFGAVDVLVDKRLDNFLHVALIKAMVPAARIVHTVRRDEDVALSIFSNLFGVGAPYSHRLDHIRHWQAQEARLMAHWQATWPGDILRFDYDAFVAAPEAGARALLAHCGLDWDPACLAPAEGARLVQTLSQWQVREPIHGRASGRAAPFAGLMG